MPNSPELAHLQTPPKAYDEHLYDAFAETASFQAYEYLNGAVANRSEQKNLFLAGDIQNPILDYPDLDLEKLGQTEASLLYQKQSLLANEHNAVIKQTYRWRLNEKIAEIRLLKAAANGNMHHFQRYSEFIYGKPTPDIFAYTVNSIRSKVQEATTSDDITISECAESLLNLLPNLPEPKIAKLPDETTISVAHEQTTNELGDLINLPDATEKLDAIQIQEAFSSALQKLGGTDWQITIDEQTSRTGISVNQEEMQVKIPQSRAAVKDKVASLILHEIGTHVARRINGERSRLKLLGLGLDRYESGEEGMATMREQALNQKVNDFSGLDGHLAIGLALGLDGQPRDFRQVYEILEKYNLLQNLLGGKDFSEAQEKAQNSAWNRCVRTFRGTDCKTPGVCFTKDVIYREGNIGVWKVIKSNPDEMIRFNVGKYDPSNPRHLWILEQLGITEQDLATLEE